MAAADTTAPAEPTEHDGEPIRYVDFAGRRHAVWKPDEGQLVVMMRLTRQAKLIRDTEDPEQRKEMLEQLKSWVHRATGVLAGLHVHQTDWDFIEQGLAERTVTWKETVALFETIAEAWKSDGDNRAGRRAAKKTTARLS